MNRGDVIRVDLPAPQGKPGREQIGERPAILLQSNTSTAKLSTIVVVPLTKNQNALRFDGTVSVPTTSENGLLYDSVALIHQLRAIDKRRVSRVAGSVSDATLENVENSIRKLLGL